MKKLVAGLLAALALGSFSNMARAQNAPASYYSSNQLLPNFCANSSGADYGCIQNGGSNSWSLGYGTSLTSNGTAALTWDATPAVTVVAPIVFTRTQVGTTASATGGIYVSSTIPATSSYESLLSSASTSVLLTSTPNIAAGVSGQYLILSSTSSASGVVFQDEGTLTGSKLQLGAASRTVSQYKTLTLIYDAVDGFWREVGFGNN